MPVICKYCGAKRDGSGQTGHEHGCPALAELEKPADDDAMDVADRIRAICFDETMGYDSFMAESLIKDFAESYHAKKCAECTQKKQPYKLFGTEPFPRFSEQRSGVTSDVDK